MILITAFHDKDAPAAERMLDFCADLSGQQPNTLILASEPSVDRTGVQRAASRAFAKLEYLPLKACLSEWPSSANDYFAMSAQAMRGRGEPWLWLESDCVPMRPDWLALIERDYFRAQKPCLGAIIPMFFNNKGQWEERGKMLAGVAVYPPDLHDRSPLMQALPRMNAEHARSHVPPMAFDCYIANEIVPASAATVLIQHMGRSRSFRREDGRLRCSYGPESRWEPFVHPETALVHGVKDQSLIDLLRQELNLPESSSSKTAWNVPQEIRVIETKPKEEPRQQWGDASQPLSTKPATQPIGNGTEPVRAITVVPTDLLEALKTARDSIQHWPQCKKEGFGLRTTRSGAHRVECKCGSASMPLPSGPNWDAAWVEFVKSPPKELPVTTAAEPKFDEAYSLQVAPMLERATTLAETTLAPGAAVIASIEQTSSKLSPENSFVPSDPVEASVHRGMMAGKDMPIYQARYFVMLELSKEVGFKIIRKSGYELPDPKTGKFASDGLTKVQRKRKAQRERAREMKAKVAVITKKYDARCRLDLSPKARKRREELLSLASETGVRGFYKIRAVASQHRIAFLQKFPKDLLVLMILEAEFGDGAYKKPPL